MNQHQMTRRINELLENPRLVYHLSRVCCRATDVLSRELPPDLTPDEKRLLSAKLIEVWAQDQFARKPMLASMK